MLRWKCQTLDPTYHLPPHFLPHPSYDPSQRLARRAIGIGIEKALAVIARHADARIERDGAEEGDPSVGSQAAGASHRGLEDLGRMVAARAHEGGHVLHHAQDADPRFAAEVELLADVQQAGFLRGGDQHGAVDAG